MTKGTGTSIGVLVAGLGIAIAVTLLMVRPISTDLSLIGQGKPALVLAYENFSPTGGEALDRLRKIRSDYEAQMHFLVADLGIPQGSHFARQHRLVDGQAVFLNQDGRPIRVTTIPSDEQELRRRLDDKLAAVAFSD